MQRRTVFPIMQDVETARSPLWPGCLYRRPSSFLRFPTDCTPFLKCIFPSSRRCRFGGFLCRSFFHLAASKWPIYLFGIERRSARLLSINSRSRKQRLLSCNQWYFIENIKTVNHFHNWDDTSCNT